VRTFIIVMLTLGIWVLSYSFWYHSDSAGAHGADHTHYARDVVDLKDYKQEDIEKIVEEGCAVVDYEFIECGEVTVDYKELAEGKYKKE